MQENNVLQWDWFTDTQGISSANDLIQIMNVGNQLYSTLSWLARQAYLMQSELPIALNVFDTDYQMEYCESYSGTVHQEIAIEGYQYCTFLPRAFESHIWKLHQFHIYSRVYYCNSNMGFKIFDSHVRDLYGRGSLKVHVFFLKYCLLIF